MDREAAERVATWLGAVDRAREHGYSEIQSLSEIPAHARRDSEFWCDEILAPAANPHDAEGARHRVCRATGDLPDLVEHELSVGDLALTMTEGRNFLLVRVHQRSLDLLALPEGERQAAIVRAAATIFREPLAFSSCASVGEGSTFCTDASVDPMTLASWASRAEGIVKGGELSFLCYKKCPQRLGFANACQWFEDDCR
jgi:hypothetical protein